ncbi:Glycosyl transferase, group 1 [Novosphingobium nitrogenifigens DSM 19370]|uniref:Glycosyl transferase, group 1 n=1 Tax=Novosphingobium nitrogenifigens DSM 19370 TaxID=983920 RepID=F1Z3F4_9SPHN|nr:Glycosyl transferase, group 1 [Novosphingobium nitrogenifigens DSM 19370]
MNFINHENIRFWVNSNFTLDQLKVLGADGDRAAVVYPGSRFLELPDVSKPFAVERSLPVRAADQPIRLLFVSRVVAHKGHRHVLRFAAALQNALARPVSVTFLGRDDPATTLRADLIQQAADCSVEVLLKGEVSEGDLHAAYAAADVFVCFSEHEGFGMPVFEAMRVGVPVICWGRTALRELMQHHPFTLDSLDFERAIAAVRVIEKGDARADWEAVQDSILHTYTASVVAGQLTAAIEGASGYWAAEPVLPTSAAGMAAARVKAELDRAVARETDTPALRPLQPCEAGENLVTVYDIQSYEALLAFDRGLDRLPAHEAPADFVLFSHREFVTAGGRRLSDGIAFSAQPTSESKSHIIFGPYERFVRGYFAAEFQLEAELNGDPSAVLELDVAVEGGAPLARMRVTAKQLQASGPPRLLFPIASEGAVVEFRIMVKRRKNCNFLFKGVTIRNMRQSVASLQDSPRVSLFGLRWFRRPALPGFGAIKIPPVASRHFERGDRLRDREWWNDAAEAYAEGLKFHRSFDHLVQMGNCLKEAQRLEESEAAYQAALLLRPDDRDAHLQIGRLYKSWDKPEEMHYHLLKAARIERASAEAFRELADGGFDLKSMSAVFG